MSIKKFGLALSLFAAFGLMACGDDSSSSTNSGDDAVVHCKFTSDATSFKSVTTDGDTTATVTGTLEKDVFTIKFDMPDDGECEDDADDADESMTIECKDGLEIMTHVVEGEEAKAAFDTAKKEAESECKDSNGKTKAELNDDEEDDDDDGDDSKCDEQCLKDLEAMNEQIEDDETEE